MAGYRRVRAHSDGRILASPTPARRSAAETALAPVIDHPHIRAIEALGMGPLHRHTLCSHAIPAGTHALKGILTSQIHARFDRQPARRGKRLARIQQFFKTFASPDTATRRAEL